MTKDEALKRPVESDYTSLTAYTRALEWYCNSLAQPVQEQNFCPRCGKRTADLAAIHTCTPPLPVQKPVAWITPDGEGFRIRFSPPTSEVPLGWDALYTTPLQRPWVGLTDEDLKPLCDEWRLVYGGWTENFARAIEQALKAKNT